MSVLRKLPDASYEVVCAHAEEIFGDVSILFLSTTTSRFFFDEKLSNKGY